MKHGVGLGLGRRRHGAGTISPSIQLTGSPYNIAEDAAIASDIGTLSVANGSGSYTFTITADPDNKFALNVDGVTLEIDQALDYETATSHSVTLQADNGVDPTFTRQFTIHVTDVEPESEAVTFDPAKVDDVVLSGGNLTATTSSSPTGIQSAQSTVSHSTGQYYCEFTIDNIAALGAVAFGVVGSTWVPGTAAYIGEDPSNGASIWPDGSVSDGAIYNGGDLPTFAEGDLISLAVDADAGKMWWRINGGAWIPNGHPQSGAGGFDISEVTLPLFAATEMDEDTDATTVNFGASAYAQNPPLDYLNWDGTDAGGTDVPADAGTPAAPTLTWTSDDTDDTPNFDVGLPTGAGDSTDAAVDDVLTIEYDVSGNSFAAPTTYLTHTLDAGDIAGTPINLSASAISDGDYEFRAFLTRGAADSSFSNTEAVTIAVAGSWTDPLDADGNVEWWYDISNAGSITTSSAGARISNIDDLSGNARHLSRAGGADPVYEQPAQNGLDGCQMVDGDDCNMVSSSFTAVNEPYVLFFVFKTGANSNNRTEPRLTCINNDIMWWRRDGSGPNAYAFAGTAVGDAGAACSTSTAYWMYTIFNGDTTSKIRLSTGTEQTGTNIGSDNMTFARLGPDSSAAQANERANCTFLEAFAISNPTADDITKAKEYIGNKWGLPTT